ncbi:MAG: phosphoribosylanthranilate isomerase [Alphaproteobacteria bacterium]|nr:phosphoribosylanthranilate isomerase [Alphaproteobacteria bacterium]
MWVKVCGVRSVADARHAEACGADAIGLNLHPPSPRYVGPGLAADLAAAVRCEVVLVVVDVSEDRLAALVNRIQPTAVQLHGHEPPGFGAWLGVPILRAWRASPGVLTRIREAGDRRFLLDAHVPGQAGGTGQRVDLELARQAAAEGELILAGGLTPENVGATIRAVRPFGVDVASGVEAAPGVKDPAKVAAFVAAARASAAGLAGPG